jgi:hypothetical protein
VAQIAKKLLYSDAVLHLHRVLLGRHLSVRWGISAELHPGHKDLVDTLELIKALGLNSKSGGYGNSSRKWYTNIIL